MPKIEVRSPEQIDEFKLIQIQDYMNEKHADLYSYTVAPGNECIWVYWGSTYPMNLYFLFREGRIADVIVD